MLRYLQRRELGERPEELVRTESTRRSLSLHLSKYMDVQKVFDSPVNTLDIDPVERRYLIGGATDGVIVIYDLHNLNGEPKCTFPMVCTAGKSNRYRHKHSVETVQWFPVDTGMFLSSGADKLLKVWDTNSLKTADEFEFSSIVYAHHMSAVARQHQLVAVACQSAKVRLIDLKTGSATHCLKGHKEAVFCCQWAPRDEYLLATGGADRKLMLWDIRRAKGCLTLFDKDDGNSKANSDSKVKSSSKSSGDAEIHAHAGSVNGLCFTDDGLHLVSFGTDNTLRTWNVARGRNTRANFGYVQNATQKCVKLCVSSSSPLVYVPSGSNIHVYDALRGRQRAVLRGHYTQVNGCVHHPDDHSLYSCGNDRNILVWTPFTSTVEAYEDHIDDLAKVKAPRTAAAITSRTLATADAWSSDED